MNFINEPRLRRKEASRYLQEKWGISRTHATLAKLAVLGGGPKFQHANRTPLYPLEELDVWAQSILSPLKSSTSDAGMLYIDDDTQEQCKRNTARTDAAGA